MKTTDENGRDHFKGHAIASEQIAKTVMKRLKFDNDTIRKVTKLVAYHDYRMEPTGANVRRAMHEIGGGTLSILSGSPACRYKSAEFL